MSRRLTSALALLGVLWLAGCGEATTEPAPTPTADPADDPADDAADPLADATPDAPETPEPDEPDMTDDEIVEGADAETWASHMGDIPFVIGPEEGFKKAKADGKPVLLFYTATW